MIICQNCLSKIESIQGNQNITSINFDTYHLHDVCNTQKEIEENSHCHTCNHWFEEGEKVILIER